MDPSMAKRKHRRNRNFFVIPVNVVITMGATVASVVVATVEPAAGFTRECFIMSARLMWAIQDHTAGEGPIQFGLHHNDLSVTEVGEGLDAVMSGSSDRIEYERSTRPIRQVGHFAGLNTDEVFNDGRALKTKVKMTFDEGFAFGMWARNQSGSTLTTGTLVKIFGNIYGVWK